jgi:hypothetical protein
MTRVPMPSPNNPPTNHERKFIDSDFLVPRGLALDAAPRRRIGRDEGPAHYQWAGLNADTEGEGQDWETKVAAFLKSRNFSNEDILEAIRLIKLRHANGKDRDMPKPATEGGMGGRLAPGEKLAGDAQTEEMRRARAASNTGRCFVLPSRSEEESRLVMDDRSSLSEEARSQMARMFPDIQRIKVM